MVECKVHYPLQVMRATTSGTVVAIKIKCKTCKRYGVTVVRSEKFGDWHEEETEQD
jgi:hypothetical protein